MLKQNTVYVCNRRRSYWLRIWNACLNDYGDFWSNLRPNVYVCVSTEQYVVDNALKPHSY